MAAWINVTSKLEQGLTIVARLDNNSKFRLLVNRICQSLQSSIDTKIFNEEEEEKLLVSLDLTKDELILLLDTITSIYTQAACNVVKPSLMETVMKDNFKIDEEKILIFTNTWMTYGKGIVENLRQKSMFPIQVKDINWCLNVQSSSSAISKDARPVALLQLGLTGDKTSTLTVEFDRKQLTDLYYNLEKIQTQLDALEAKITSDVLRTKIRALHTTRTTTIIIRNKIMAVRAPTIHPSFSSAKVLSRTSVALPISMSVFSFVRVNLQVHFPRSE